MKILKTTLITFLGAILVAATAYADHGRYQTSNVIDVSGAGKGYQGAAWLDRTEDGISGRIMSKVSSAGDPYTLWVVVFNNPSACVDGCDEGDLGIAEVGASVFNGTGAISTPDGGLKRNGKPAGGGVVNFDFSVPAHALPSGLFLLFGDPAGLHEGNGYGAEIHLVVDKHPSIPLGISWLDDLTTTNFPGMGPATNDAVAVFLACPDDTCPDGVL
jgi:hypothetical protein